MLGTDEDVGMRGAVGQKNHRKRKTTEREGRRRLAGLGKAHAAKIEVEDDGAELHEWSAENPVIQADGAAHGQVALVTGVAKSDSIVGELEGLTGDGEA